MKDSWLTSAMSSALHHSSNGSSARRLSNVQWKMLEHAEDAVIQNQLYQHEMVRFCFLVCFCLFFFQVDVQSEEMR